MLIILHSNQLRFILISTLHCLTGSSNLGRATKCLPNFFLVPVVLWLQRKHPAHHYLLVSTLKLSISPDASDTSSPQPLFQVFTLSMLQREYTSIQQFAEEKMLHLKPLGSLDSPSLPSIHQVWLMTVLHPMGASESRCVHLPRPPPLPDPILAAAALLQKSIVSEGVLKCHQSFLLPVVIVSQREHYLQIIPIIAVIDLPPPEGVNQSHHSANLLPNDDTYNTTVPLSIIHPLSSPCSFSSFCAHSELIPCSFSSFGVYSEILFLLVQSSCIVQSIYCTHPRGSVGVMKSYNLHQRKCSLFYVCIMSRSNQSCRDWNLFPVVFSQELPNAC
jgi:hypothetical protein